MHANGCIWGFTKLSKYSVICFNFMHFFQQFNLEEFGEHLNLQPTTWVIVIVINMQLPLDYQYVKNMKFYFFKNTNL